MTPLQTFDSLTHSHSLQSECEQRSYTWTILNSSPFDELLISWNAQRPLSGHYVILSRVWIQNQWSPWLLYAVWGSQDQFSFHDKSLQASVHSFQDQVEVLDGQTATGFSIRIEACHGATLEEFYDLYACTSRLESPKPIWRPPLHSYRPLPVPGISQLCFTHPHSRSFCSPASTTAVIQYLLSNQQLHPVQFAKQVYDAGFDIYGNWPFNAAQAFVELGLKWRCFCARMGNIEWLWKSLKQGLPLVISIKGTLPRAFLPYSSGHLIVIKGYDASTHQFLCMDPAFPTDEQTEISYPWEELMQAWEHRHYLAYFFFPRKK